MLDEQSDNYMRLMAAGDMHALMFRLRSELMRGAAGGNGYNRDGNVAFRKHRLALHPTCISLHLPVSPLHPATSPLPLPGGLPQAPLRPISPLHLRYISRVSARWPSASTASRST